MKTPEINEMFSTPEKLSEVQDWIELHNSDEKIHLYTAMIMTSNYYINLIAEAEAKENEKDPVKEAVCTILEACNSFGANEKIMETVVDALSKEHRTIQQVFVGVMHNAMVEYGKRHATYYDGRNEASVKYARQLAEMNVFFPFI